jgi:hypothetical protein
MEGPVLERQKRHEALGGERETHQAAPIPKLETTEEIDSKAR